MSVSAAENALFFVDENGDLFQCGEFVSEDCYGLPIKIPMREPVSQISAGTGRSLGIVTSQKNLYMLGRLWDGTVTITPKLVPREHFHFNDVQMVACASNATVVLTDGGVYTAGRGSSGILGHGGNDDEENEEDEEDEEESEDDEEDEEESDDDEEDDEESDDDEEDDEKDQVKPKKVSYELFDYERIVMVAAGEFHVVALSEYGHIFTWGDGFDGKLGHNDENHQYTPKKVEPRHFSGKKVVFVAAGGDHTVAVTEEGQLYTWGCHSCGQLGHGQDANTGDWLKDFKNRLVPTLVSTSKFENESVVMAACGKNHTMVLKRDGFLWACGVAKDLQLGILPTAITADIMPEFCPVSGATFKEHIKFVEVAASAAFTAALTDTGQIWTWGRNEMYNLGYETENEPQLYPKQITEFWDPKAKQVYAITKVGRAQAINTQIIEQFKTTTLGSRLKGDLIDQVLFMARMLIREEVRKEIERKTKQGQSS